MSNQPSPPPQRTEAAVKRSRWPGWIWAVPIAALLLMGWWALRTLARGGEDITISFDDVHGLKQDNTTVVYRGMNVGKVRTIALAKDGNSVTVTVNIEKSAAQFLTSGTQFWLRGAQPSLSDPSSLSTVLTGPTIVMAPGPGDKATHFVGLTHEPVISGAHGKPQVYAVSLSGTIGKLKQGEPVTLLGFTVGEVKDVGFHYDAGTGEIATPVTLALYPALFHLGDGAGGDADATLAATIDRLMRKGLHARLERDPPLIGNPQVSLEMVPGSSGATPSAMNGVPQIPAAPDNGLNSIAARIDKLPIEQIGQNLLDITSHVDKIVSSPGLDDAIAQLDATVQQLHQIAGQEAPKLAELMDGLRKTARQLDDAAKAADKVLGGTPSQEGTQQAMREITEAARSVRDLANYLDRHPEALIKGRSAQ